MNKIKLVVGRYAAGSGGVVQDSTRPVEFEGEKLAVLKRFEGLNDTRGVTETLCKADDGRIIVHVEQWSHWQGEPNVYTLHQVTEADLQPGGRFEDLGREAGYGRPLTLDEALSADKTADGGDLDS